MAFNHLKRFWIPAFAGMTELESSTYKNLIDKALAGGLKAT